MLADRRRQAGGLEQEADPASELRPGRGRPVPGEEHVAVALQAPPSSTGVHDEAVPQLVPVDQLQSPRLVEQVEPVGKLRITEHESRIVRATPVTGSPSRTSAVVGGDVELPALVELHARVGTAAGGAAARSRR